VSSRSVVSRVPPTPPTRLHPWEKRSPDLGQRVMFEDAQLKSALRDRDEAGDWFVAFRDHHLFARQGRLNQPGELRPCDVNDNLPRDSRSSDSRLDV
jgi:hypothetical protein